MSRHPEPGDAVRAMVKFEARLRVAVDNVGSDGLLEDAGEVTFTAHGPEGDGAEVFRIVYGDLFDPRELLLGAISMLEGFVNDLGESDREIRGTLTSLFMQGVGTGVLMERARWER